MWRKSGAASFQMDRCSSGTQNGKQNEFAALRVTNRLNVYCVCVCVCVAPVRPDWPCRQPVASDTPSLPSLSSSCTPETPTFTLYQFLDSLQHLQNIISSQISKVMNSCSNY